MMALRRGDTSGFRDECGVFGVYGHQDAAALTALGLHALQHRGQEAAGIVSWDGAHYRAHRDLGLVGEIFSDQKIIDRLRGHAALGHTRYSTTGDTIQRNAQPIFADIANHGFAVAHNGNLTNASTLRNEMAMAGALFQSTADTEILVHLMARVENGHEMDLATRMAIALRQVHGAYAIGGLGGGSLFGVRDPQGVRPLLLGRLGEGEWILASESCAFDIIGADIVREIDPGEMVVIDGNGIRSVFPFLPSKRYSCVFEFIYFARPDSIADGMSVYDVRRRLGIELARETHDTDCADTVIVPVPDSGVPAAIGYAEQVGCPMQFGIIRNHYVGRTFIEPTDHIRNLGVRLKHNANRSVVAGKRVFLIDDSLVRGTTARKIVDMVRGAGANEVHLRIAAPPTICPCFYGVDTPDKSELMATRMDLAEMQSQLQVDSLRFLSLSGLYRALSADSSGRPCQKGDDNTGYCDACFTGNYPLPLTDQAEEAAGVGMQLSLLAD